MEKSRGSVSPFRDRKIVLLQWCHLHPFPLPKKRKKTVTRHCRSSAKTPFALPNKPEPNTVTSATVLFPKEHTISEYKACTAFNIDKHHIFRRTEFFDFRATLFFCTRRLNQHKKRIIFPVHSNHVSGTFPEKKSRLCYSCQKFTDEATRALPEKNEGQNVKGSTHRKTPPAISLARPPKLHSHLVVNVLIHAPPA